ncbi:hypothetical protein CONLIGDRAFT_293415 [Coniochaeta ligniaria NRRL 30616]|uniref:Uncharacterized protein n=1 Tax=Coniochaeta ligniaria NRRL 30616 TaxID=1408157 RepID=A0A1J7JLZ1_9PEZI|nr:hypothetical protein CONLIGDRAFT_293415 [Coniochaeta ligniaria NRRL 30616]
MVDTPLVSEVLEFGSGVEPTPLGGRRRVSLLLLPSLDFGTGARGRLHNGLGYTRQPHRRSGGGRRLRRLHRRRCRRRHPSRRRPRRHPRRHRPRPLPRPSPPPSWPSSPPSSSSSPPPSPPARRSNARRNSATSA